MERAQDEATSLMERKQDEATTVRVAHLQQNFPRLRIMPSTRYTRSLFVTLRNKESTRSEFIFAADNLLRFLCEEAVAHIPYDHKAVLTPGERVFKGVSCVVPTCGVSILRSGECLESALRSVVRGVCIGKILIQRDESLPNKPPKLFYAKLPSAISEQHVMLLDPMLASGGSALEAVRVLVENGVQPNRITFINLIAAPEGIERFCQAYPEITVVTGAVDDTLNSEKYILPGIGDFGDRYFGT